MNNRGRPSATRGGDKTIDISVKKKRTPQDRFAYSKLYWDKKLKAIIDASYKEHCNGLQPGEEPIAPIQWRNTELQRLYDEETEEVKAEVEAYRGQFKENGGKAVEDELSGISAELQATLELQRCVFSSKTTTYY